jgi:hypothetical protein
MEGSHCHTPSTSAVAASPERSRSGPDARPAERYRTRRPVTVRPITRRWISGVPSNITRGCHGRVS